MLEALPPLAREFPDILYVVVGDGPQRRDLEKKAEALGVHDGDAASVDVDLQQVLSIALERSSISFGNTVSGATPAPISDHVTVVSTDTAGYALTVHRSAFVPSDLPLGLSVSGGAIVPIPVAPAADLLIGGASARSAAAGDVWPTSVGFSAPLPVAAPGHYTATLTFTVIGR